ncbi:MAG: hypothetical protein AAGC55_06000 [Myxococcota bacterium]
MSDVDNTAESEAAETAGHQADAAGAGPERSEAVAQADAVKLEPSTAERQQRRRVLVQGLIVTSVLISGWIGVMIAVQTWSSDDYDFRAESERVLEQIRDGKADQVYRDASPRLHRLMVADRFLDFATDVRQTMGGFREILAIKQVEATSAPAGETRRAKATAVFDNGMTLVSFSYHWHDEQWKLLRVAVDLPEEMVDGVVAQAETRAARKQAPKEVYALAQGVFDMVRKGRSDEVWEAASPTFKHSVDKDAFLAMQSERRRELGPYIRILDTLPSSRNASRKLATMTAIVQYRRARARVTMGFIRMDDVWKLSYYKVVPPALPVPQARSTAPPQ